tara:strand:+ start:922 stop:1152 length:231 start_codon:yes stop_codon:yes gene_type:complete
MTHLIVDNEGEIELGIGIAVELAQTSKDPVRLELSFPSVGLMKIFSTNLVNSFINDNVPKDNKLELIFNVPDEHEH